MQWIRNVMVYSGKNNPNCLNIQIFATGFDNDYYCFIFVHKFTGNTKKVFNDIILVKPDSFNF